MSGGLGEYISQALDMPKPGKSIRRRHPRQGDTPPLAWLAGMSHLARFCGVAAPLSGRVNMCPGIAHVGLGGPLHTQ